MFRDPSVVKKQMLAAVTVLMLTIAGSGTAAMVDGEELIDPTAPFLLEMENTGNQPLANVFARFNNYEVSSILIRDSLRIAVINSQRVREGEFVGNARVVSIGQNSVTIDLDGESRILNLHGASIKSSTGNQ